MNHAEAIQNKKDQIANSNGALSAETVYVIPEIREEADAFLEFILRGAIKYSDELSLNYSSNGKFTVWISQ